MMCRTQVLPRCYHVLCPLRVLFEYCKCYWFNTYSILPNQTLFFFFRYYNKCLLHFTLLSLLIIKLSCVNQGLLLSLQVN